MNLGNQNLRKLAMKLTEFEELKALSIQQPWANAIIYGTNVGFKDIENRTWNTSFRGKFYVHVGQKIDKESIRGFDNLAIYLNNPDLKTGGIIGIVELEHVFPPNDGINNNLWKIHGQYGFLLRNPQPIEFIPCKGQLGFFTPKIDT